jgi:hypothetical protein
MALDKLNPKLINTTGASDGDALVFRSSNSQIEFGAVSTDTSGIVSGISGANTNINTVQANADSFASYANSTFSTDTNLNTVQGNIDAFASYANSTLATTSYVDTEIAGLVDSAPAALDTLNELAAALGNDANLSTTLTTSIGTVSSNAAINATNLDTLGSYSNSTFATNTNLNTVQSNVATVETNLDTFGSYANSTFGDITSINTVSSNVDAAVHGLTGANTNLNIVQSNVTVVETNLNTFGTYANTTFNTIQSNLDAYATYANTTFTGGGSGDAGVVEGNLSAFASYANSTFALNTNLNVVQANLDSFASYANTTLAPKTTVDLVEGNLTSFANYVNTNLHYTSEQFTSAAATNTFALATSVSDANNILVSISGVVQSPNDDYTVSGNTLTLNNTNPIPADLKVEVRNLAVRGRVPMSGTIGWTYLTTNATTLTANASYFIDVSDGPKTVYLPNSPVLGSTVKIVDVAGLAASNTITVGGNSEKIQRESTDLLVTSNAAGFTLIYSTAAYGWLLGEV